VTGATQAREEPPPTVLVDERAISAHVERIAGRITRDHPDGVVLVGVLKGGNGSQTFVLQPAEGGNSFRY